MLTTHPLLVPRLRKSRSYTSCHPNAPLWSVTGPLYLFFTFASGDENVCVDLLRCENEGIVDTNLSEELTASIFKVVPNRWHIPT
jgi:hypothetical protein